MPKGVNLTEEQKAEIQTLSAEHVPPKRIARKLGLSPTTVNRVANGAAKRHRIVLYLTDREIADLIAKCGVEIVFKFERDHK